MNQRGELTFISETDCGKCLYKQVCKYKAQYGYMREEITDKNEDMPVIVIMKCKLIKEG